MVDLYEYHPGSDSEHDDEFTRGQKRFNKFTSTYGRWAQRILVEADISRSPLHVATFLDRMPNLQDLTLRGIFEHRTSEFKPDEEKNIPF